MINPAVVLARTFMTALLLTASSAPVACATAPRSDENIRCADRSEETMIKSLASASGLVTPTAMYEPGEVQDLLTDLRCLVASHNAASNLHRLFSEGNTAGKMFALIGMRKENRQAFDTSSRQFETSGDRVVLLGGDVARSEPVPRIVESIAHGLFDPLLSKGEARPVNRFERN